MYDSQEEEFWTQRYLTGSTGWNIGYVSTPIKSYFDQLTDPSLKILIPGAGNSYEAEYVFQTGFPNVFVLDIARPPLDSLKKRVPTFPDQQLLHENFFEHHGQYDLIIEQTFFCSFTPEPANRYAYARHVHQLLKPGGKLVGLWFCFPINANHGNRPFGGSKEEYLGYFEPLFDIEVFEACYNSIPPRQGNELFGIMRKK